MDPCFSSFVKMTCQAERCHIILIGNMCKSLIYICEYFVISQYEFLAPIVFLMTFCLEIGRLLVLKKIMIYHIPLWYYNLHAWIYLLYQNILIAISQWVSMAHFFSDWENLHYLQQQTLKLFSLRIWIVVFSLGCVRCVFTWMCAKCWLAKSYAFLLLLHVIVNRANSINTSTTTTHWYRFEFQMNITFIINMNNLYPEGKGPHKVRNPNDSPLYLYRYQKLAETCETDPADVTQGNDYKL